MTFIIQVISSKMNKYILLIIIMGVFLISASSVSAEIKTEIDIQDSFGIGENIVFNYTLTLNIDTQAVIMPHVECSSAPVKMISEKTIELKAGEPYKNSYADQVVQDWFEPQTCTAYVQILSPIQQRTEKQFEIKTDPSFSFEILLNKKVFIKNQDIDIDYDSEVENPKITAILTYPDKTTKQITLPTQIKAEQIGTYTLETTASKQGYKTITKKTQFGVIEKEVEISYVSENTSAKRQPLSDTFKLILAGAVVLTVIIGLTVFFRRRKRSGFVPPIG